MRNNLFVVILKVLGKCQLREVVLEKEGWLDSLGNVIDRLNFFFFWF